MYSVSTVHIQNVVWRRNDDDNWTVHTQSDLVRAIGGCVPTPCNLENFLFGKLGELFGRFVFLSDQYPEVHRVPFHLMAMPDLGKIIQTFQILQAFLNQETRQVRNVGGVRLRAVICWTPLEQKKCFLWTVAKLLGNLVLFNRLRVPYWWNTGLQTGEGCWGI